MSNWDLIKKKQPKLHYFPPKNKLVHIRSISHYNEDKLNIYIERYKIKKYNYVRKYYEPRDYTPIINIVQSPPIKEIRNGKKPARAPIIPIL